jgi:hypothetical protein
MNEQSPHLESLQDIRQLMQKSSRFISLSGLSGIAAGTCALIASWFAFRMIDSYGYDNGLGEVYDIRTGSKDANLESDLFLLAVVTFLAAFSLAFFFTWLRSKKTGVPIWGFMARKVLISVAIPMIAGGIMIWRFRDLGLYGFIAPACLLFYGLALINTSKFTYSEIRYLGLAQLVLGTINLWMMGRGLIFWALGFGVLHIIYGFIMWWRYERNLEAAKGGLKTGS